MRNVGRYIILDGERLLQGLEVEAVNDGIWPN